MAQPLSKAKLSYFRRFLQKKHRLAEGLFLLEGWHLLEEALACGRDLRGLVFDVAARREPAEASVLQKAVAATGEVFEATSEQMSRISDTKASQGVAALVERVGLDFETWMERLPREGPVRLLAMDEVADPGNCGAIVRSCDWFGLDGVLLGRGCAELENGKTARATMGSLFHLPVASGIELVAALNRLTELGVTVVTTELDGAESLAGFAFPERCVLVLGNEARGVSPEIAELASTRVFAPRFGRAESLNVASAAAVFLAAWRGI